LDEPICPSIIAPPMASKLNKHTYFPAAHFGAFRPTTNRCKIMA